MRTEISEDKLIVSLSRQFRALQGSIRAQGKDIAKAIGRSESYITQIRNAQILPDAGDLVRIARFFDKSVDYLLGLEEVIPTQDQGAPVRVVKNQLEADKEIESFIRQIQPPSAYFIQYSSDNVTNVLKYLKELEECEVFLLLKHPGVSSLPNPNLDEISSIQQEKIIAQIRSLMKIDRANYPRKLHIRLYPFPGAMRAIYLGTPLGALLKAVNPDGIRADLSDDNGEAFGEVGLGLLSLTFYRYVDVPDHTGVIGDTNPLIHVFSNSLEGKMLYTLFENTFVELWKKGLPVTEDLLDAIKAVKR